MSIPKERKPSLFEETERYDIGNIFSRGWRVLQLIFSAFWNSTIGTFSGGTYMVKDYDWGDVRRALKVAGWKEDQGTPEQERHPDAAMAKAEAAATLVPGKGFLLPNGKFGDKAEMEKLINTPVIPPDQPRVTQASLTGSGSFGDIIPPGTESVYKQFVEFLKPLESGNPDGEDKIYQDRSTLAGGWGHQITTEEADEWPLGKEVPLAQREAWLKKDTTMAYGKAFDQLKDLGIMDRQVLIILASANYQLGSFSDEFDQSFKLLKQGKFDEAIENIKKSPWYKGESEKDVNRAEHMISAIERIKGIQGGKIAPDVKGLEEYADIRMSSLDTPGRASKVEGLDGKAEENFSAAASMPKPSEIDTVSPAFKV